MQLFLDNTHANLIHFIKRIESSPYSWRMMSLEFKFPKAVDEKFFRQQCHQFLNEHFENLDCDIYWFQEKHLMLFIFQGRALPIEKCIDYLIKSLAYSDVQTAFDILDFSVDWKEFLVLVKNILPATPSVKENKPAEIEHKEVPQEIAPSLGKRNGFFVKLDPQKILLGNSLRKSRVKPLIMLVEDDILFQKLVKVSLEGYEVVVAETAMQGLVYYQRHLPDVVFLDINLPDGNGLNILEEISEADPLSYVVMLSGDAMKEKIVASLEAGAKTFVAKPFNRKRLLDIVAEFILHKRQVKY